jgi:hypothetical protein
VMPSISAAIATSEAMRQRADRIVVLPPTKGLYSF